MTGRRVADSSGMDVLLQSRGICDQDVEALLTSAATFLGVQPLTNSGDLGSNILGDTLYEPVVNVEEICDDALEECLQQPEKKRRLTSGQVQSLEKTFELENKLEPERKVQIAKDLGLLPRQVAIWFQNRRARWKTKQLEKDYEALKSSYDALKVEHDKLLREKEELEAQVLTLTSRILSKEKDTDNFRFFESLDIDRSMVSDQVRSTVDSSVGICKQQQDVRSAKSFMLDAESGEHSMVMMMKEPTSCSSNNTFEPDQSDLSQVDADILSIEQNSSNYEFQFGDHSFWSWP